MAVALHAIMVVPVLQNQTMNACILGVVKDLATSLLSGLACKEASQKIIALLAFEGGISVTNFDTSLSWLEPLVPIEVVGVCNKC